MSIFFQKFYVKYIIKKTSTYITHIEVCLMFKLSFQDYTVFLLFFMKRYTASAIDAATRRIRIQPANVKPTLI